MVGLKIHFTKVCHDQTHAPRQVFYGWYCYNWYNVFWLFSGNAYGSGLYTRSNHDRQGKYSTHTVLYTHSVKKAVVASQSMETPSSPIFYYRSIFLSGFTLIQIPECCYGITDQSAKCSHYYFFIYCNRTKKNTITILVVIMDHFDSTLSGFDARFIDEESIGFIYAIAGVCFVCSGYFLIKKSATRESALIL